MSSCLGLRRFIVSAIRRSPRDPPESVSIIRHPLDARSELLEVDTFSRPKRILPEKRDNPLQQILLQYTE